MKTIQISLNSIDKVKAFVNDITKFDNDFDLVSGRYVIDAKSIMGIFSLDLSKPIDLSIHAEENLNEILEILKPYMICIRRWCVDLRVFYKAAAIQRQLQSFSQRIMIVSVFRIVCSIISSITSASFVSDF